MKTVIYTSIFGSYDGLIPQPKFKNIDFICFTDQDFKSKNWIIKKQSPPFPNDNTRSSRVFKILPHKYLQEYDRSVFIDGNYIVKNNITQLIDRLDKSDMLVFDHNQCDDARNTVQEELNSLIKIGNKENPEVMKKQVDEYIEDGFPDNTGLVSSAVLLRNHMQPNVINTMNFWWEQLLKHSRRDQLSFNYAAWKTNLNYQYVDGDLRSNQYVKMLGKHRKNYRMKYLRYRLKHFLGLV